MWCCLSHCFSDELATESEIVRHHHDEVVDHSLILSSAAESLQCAAMSHFVGPGCSFPLLAPAFRPHKQATAPMQHANEGKTA